MNLSKTSKNEGLSYDFLSARSAKNVYIRHKKKRKNTLKNGRNSWSRHLNFVVGSRRVLKTEPGSYLNLNISFPGCFCAHGVLFCTSIAILVASNWAQIQDSCMDYGAGFELNLASPEPTKNGKRGTKKYPTRQKHFGNELFRSR